MPTWKRLFRPWNYRSLETLFHTLKNCWRVRRKLTSINKRFVITDDLREHLRRKKQLKPEGSMERAILTNLSGNFPANNVTFLLFSAYSCGSFSSTPSSVPSSFSVFARTCTRYPQGHMHACKHAHDSNTKSAHGKIALAVEHVFRRWGISSVYWWRSSHRHRNNQRNVQRAQCRVTPMDVFHMGLHKRKVCASKRHITMLQRL